MNKGNFEEVAKMEKVFGQFVSLVSVTDPDAKLKPEFRKQGILKISKFQAHVRKDFYLEVLNKSTLAKEEGIEFKAKRESHYNDIALNGFCCSLKSDPSRLYFQIRFNEKDSEPEKVCYISASGQQLTAEDILKEKPKAGTFRGQLVESAKVSVRVFAIENIAFMRISGKEFTDSNLSKYLDYVK